MNIILIYITLIILVLLIVFYFSMKAYLMNTQTTTISINDGDLIDNSCIYHANSSIISCVYLINGKKIFITKSIENLLQMAPSPPIIFNADDIGLPKNGVLTISFVSHLNKKNKKNKKNNYQSIQEINNEYTNNTRKYNSISYNRSKINNMQMRQVNPTNFEKTTLSNIENIENSNQGRYFNIMFNNKYPTITATNKMANIDSDYFIGGLHGDARLLD